MRRYKKIFAAILLAGLLLLGGGCNPATGGDTAAPAAENPARDDFRAVWVASVYNLDYPNKGTADSAALKAQADQILQTCADMGMNAVILQVRPSCDALYPSSLFPWSKYLTGSQSTAPTGGFDPLAYWVEHAHALGLELHAWVNPFRITKGGQTEFAALSPQSPAVLHPEWVVQHEKNFYLDPGIPQVRELVIQGAEELVRNYDLDGIHLDDYFYPGKDFNDAKTFAQYGGSYKDLGDWRRENVNTLIRDLDSRLHTLNPKISFGVSPSGVWADRSSLREGSGSTGKFESYYVSYADSRKWVKNGWVDYICPQIYWEIGNKTLDYKTIATWWADTVRDTGVKLYIGMADYRADDGKPASPWYGLDAITAQLAFNRSLPEVAGEAHFRYQFLAKNTNLTALYKAQYAPILPPPSGFLTKLPAAEQTHWAAPYYGKLGDLGVVTGMPDGSYSPELPVSRGSMAKLVFSALPRWGGTALTESTAGNPLPDTAGTWSEPYIVPLCAAGYLEGSDYPDGFHEGQPMTRGELVKLIMRAKGWSDDGSITTCSFPDVTGNFYYIEKAADTGLITGYPNGNFGPHDPVKRGDAAAILMRAVEGT
ncbi:MAG: family 10 glycosylhydrolase [Pseudoflavonifractor sp.]